MNFFRHSPIRLGLALFFALAICGLTGLPGASAQQQKQKQKEREEADQIDHVALATRLVKDGHYDRAEKVLADVDLSQEGTDLADYYTLRGLIALNQQRFSDAAKHLDEAIRHGKVEDIVFVYLAQAFYGMKDWKRTVRAIENADEEGDKIANIQLMKARSHWKLRELDKAWEVLNRGASRFPERPEFDRQRIFLLLELGLYQEATELGNRYLQRQEAKAEDYLAIGEALRRNREWKRAIDFLEKARLLYPDHPKVVVQLAHTWVDYGKPLAGAELFQRASSLDPRFVSEAAELYRRAGEFQRALYMNSQISEQKEKFRQRVAILLDQQEFEKVAAMEPRLERLDLLRDQSVLYALAYSKFKTGDFDAAERLLKKVTDPELFKSATQLRKVMSYCQEHPEAC